MLTTLVMTVISPDRPGLVQAVAARVADQGGNWLESRMCRLGGQFAGILRVEVEASRADGLAAALRGLEAEGMRILLHTEAGQPVTGPGSRALLEVVGQDRPGILRQVTAVLAARGVNVEDLASERVSAPMGGGTLFQARATLLLPADTGLTSLRAELERAGTDLMVDLRPAPETR